VMVFLLHVGRLTLAISRFASRNRILCEAALRHLQLFVVAFIKQVQNIETSKASSVEVVS